MSNKTKKTDRQELSLDQRDFMQEYNELLEKFGYSIDYIDNQWQQNNGHIQKFTLLETTPTPTLSDHTFINNL